MKRSAIGSVAMGLLVMGATGLLAIGCADRPIDGDDSELRVVDLGVSKPEEDGPYAGCGDGGCGGGDGGEALINCGALWVHTTADLIAAQQCQTATDLFIMIDTATNTISLPKLVSLPNLVEVSHFIHVYRTSGVESVDLPSLKQVGGLIYVFLNDDLQRLRMPALETVGRHIYINSNPRLRVVRLPSVKTLGTFLQVRNNPLLTTFAIDNLQHVGPTTEQEYWVDLRDNVAWTPAPLAFWNAATGDPSKVHVSGNKP